MGFFSQEEFLELKFEQFAYGYNWLLMEGENQIPSDVKKSSIFLARVPDLLQGGEVAPRTSIGTDIHGNLMMMVVDGIEQGTPPVGMTLYQQALVS